jgi:ribosomal protein L9
MEVILVEKVDRLGGLGDLVNVRSGFARNYLLPTGKAKVATAENVAEIEARRAEFEKVEAEAQSAAEVRRDQLSKLDISITAKSGAEGKLFGSIGNTDHGYARFKCHCCKRTFNERSGTPFNRLEIQTDIVLQVVRWYLQMIGSF